MILDMNVLITGANGFLGKTFTRKQLELGNTVFAIVSNKEDMNDITNNNLHVFELLFEDYNTIASKVNNDVDVAYHFAWSGLNGKEAKDLDKQFQSIKATQVLLEELKKLSLNKFVFVSTMNTLELRSVLSKPQQYKTRGVHIHVSAKIMAEIIARNFCEENNIEYNEGIVAMAYGEGNHSKMIANVFIYSLLNNIKPKLVEGNNFYDIVYVDDVANALHSIGTKGTNKKSYYVGHNWNKTFKEIFTEIKDIIDPSIQLTFGDFPDDNKIDFSLIDREELTKDTGWTIKTSFKDSIIKTANWIKVSNIKFVN